MRLSEIRYLLLQVRKPEDPMRQQEVRCFRRALQCNASQIQVMDLIQHVPTVGQLRNADVVLMGGAGDYSVAAGGAWLHDALEATAQLHSIGKPTFASCWGFQALARALGGEVITDVERAEVGTFEIQLTEAGRQDPILGSLGSPFLALEGHQDIVTRLPQEAVLLATTQSGIYQSFTFPGVPIYCTQFHPELDRESFMQRVIQYPEYVERTLGISLTAFRSHCHETPRANTLLRRFIQHVFDLPKRLAN